MIEQKPNNIVGFDQGVDMHKSSGVFSQAVIVSCAVNSKQLMYRQKVL